MNMVMNIISFGVPKVYSYTGLGVTAGSNVCSAGSSGQHTNIARGIHQEYWRARAS